MVPFLGPARDQGLRMFFSRRDEQGRSVTGASSLVVDERGVRVRVESAPVLGPGPLGGFDDSGAMGACLVEHGGRQFLYYIGWSLGVTVPFATYIGLAISEDGGRTFTRPFSGPVIGRSASDPFLATSPWVRIENGRFRMWYASGDRWEPRPEGPRHYYRIMYAESADGLEWMPTGHVCIDFSGPDEYAIARPCVVRDRTGYHMWFSCRGSVYRIGYARSDDGLAWDRDDAGGGLEPAPGDHWDSESVEYGCVFNHRAARWMLFNGNDYGRTGIGLARWEEAA